MKRLILILTFLPALCFGQYKIYVNGIVGQYSMKDIKIFQAELNDDLTSSGVPTKIVSEFPASVQLDVGLDKIYESGFSLGGYLNYTFTKGRMHYRDYSGEVYSDQNVSRIVIGAKASKLLQYGFEFYGKVGINYSTLDLEFVSTINNQGYDADELAFYSTGINMEPGISWTYSYKRLLFSIQTSYEINIQGKTIFKEDEDAYLLNKEGSKVIVNWTGLRSGIGIGIRVN